MLFSGGACSRRVSRFKAVLFSAKMRKARERERRSWELGESGRILSLSSLVLFCVECRGREEREAKRLFFLGMKKKKRIMP